MLSESIATVDVPARLARSAQQLLGSGRVANIILELGHTLQACSVFFLCPRATLSLKNKEQQPNVFSRSPPLSAAQMAPQGQWELMSWLLQAR